MNWGVISGVGIPKRPHLHSCVAVLSVRLEAEKPRSEGYTSNPSSIGEHIRKRRLDLGLHQSDVASLIGCSPWSVLNWEKNRTTPHVRFVPKITEFLGYVPFDTEQEYGRFG